MKIIQPNWPAPSHIHAFTTTRQGGYSLAPYAGLNLGMHVGDDPVHVEQNRALLKKEYNLPSEPSWLSQCHSTKAVVVDDAYTLCEADASYTMENNKVCAVLTADCLPLLVCNQAGTEIAAIHAGWRGLADGVIEATLRQLKNRPETLLVWLGPAASKAAYEVGTEVREAFLRDHPEAETGFTPTTKDYYFVDLYHLARQRLKHLGVTSIYGGDYCTIGQSDLFYSYRREGVTGRMASLIWKNKD
jgi:YfiH family protein